jgi:hypothetical protein
LIPRTLGDRLASSTSRDRVGTAHSRHPTADGRTLAALVPGAELAGARVLSVEQIPYRHASTYDILPDSETGAHFAGGVLIGSTLADGGGRARPGR